MRNKLITILTASFGVFAATSVRAQVIAYDGFDYTANTMWATSLSGLNGGVGWGSTWSATAAAVGSNVSPGLSYTGLPTTGGGVVLGYPQGYPASGGQTASLQRDLTGTLASLSGATATPGSGTVWVSLLYQNWSTSNGGLSGFREAKLGLFSGATASGSGVAAVNGTERLDIGTPNTYAVGASDTLSLYSGSTFVSSGLATPRGADPANTVFILLKISLDNSTATDTASVWFDPNIAGGEAGLGTATTFTAADLSSVNAIRLAAGNLNASGTNAVWEADEVRVGLTFTDAVSAVAVPEPSVIAVAAAGGFAILLWRRKR